MLVRRALTEATVEGSKGFGRDLGLLFEGSETAKSAPNAARTRLAAAKARGRQRLKRARWRLSEGYC